MRKTRPAPAPRSGARRRHREGHEAVEAVVVEYSQNSLRRSSTSPGSRTGVASPARRCRRRSGFLPTCSCTSAAIGRLVGEVGNASCASTKPLTRSRSEEHTSELQSRQYLVCRLLLEKK